MTMKIDLIKRKFEECKSTKSYKRINHEHPIDIYVGYNELNQQSFIVIAKSKYIEIDSSKMIEVKLSKRTDNKLSLSFSLLDDNMSDIFYQFCSDIIEKTCNLKNYSPITFVVDRWKKWVQMFKDPSNILMSENEVRGLIGELIFLNEFMFNKYGIMKSLESWTGSSLSHKDYEIDDTWYEIKAIRENAMTVEISSIEQLESEFEGNLVTIKLEPSNYAIIEPISLNAYIKTIEEKLTNNEEISIFNKKLDQRKYFYNDEYDKYIYCNKGITSYKVKDNFPRIKRKELKDGIAKISYQLYVDKLKEYMEVGE